MSGVKLFNFNVHGSYYLPDHLKYWDRCNDKTELILDYNAGKVAFKYFDPREKGGIILRMQTIPSEIYHLFLTGQVVNGDFVTFRVVNTEPEFFLSPEITWKIGHEEVRTVCFRALSNKTHLIIKTNVDCFLNYAPYSFIIHSLDIIPDANMCKGYIEGPQGLTGSQGPVGAAGNDPDFAASGPEGETGPDGITGDIGNQGRRGFIGPIGIQGTVGPIGPPGSESGNTGPPGPTGVQGIMGPMGPLGSQGPIGPLGLIGDFGTIGSAGPPGATGTLGIDGPQGPTGYLGPPGLNLGDNITTGSFSGSWSRGGVGPVGPVTMNWQKVGDVVTLHSPAFPFPSLPVPGSAALVFNNPLPLEIRTQVQQQSWFTTIIEDNGGTGPAAPFVETVFQLGGPAGIIIYKSGVLDSFFPGDTVDVFPAVTLTYKINT